ncbi:unnamed protein product, partial [Rotaria socialis]
SESMEDIESDKDDNVDSDTEALEDEITNLASQPQDTVVDPVSLSLIKHDTVP